MKRIFFIFVLCISLLSSSVLAVENFQLGFSGTDIDGDNFFAYLVIFNGKNLSVEKIPNISSIYLPDGTLEKFFLYNKSLEDGYYKYNYAISDKPDILEYQVNVSDLPYTYAKPMPEKRVTSNYYIQNQKVNLEQTVTFKNIGSNGFISFPLYEPINSGRNCINETYYDLTNNKIENVSINSDFIVVKAANIEPNSERGFKVKCLLNQQISTNANGENLFGIKIYLNDDGDFKTHTINIYFPESDFLSREINFVSIEPNSIPEDDGQHKLIQYIQTGNNKESTYRILIAYNYQFGFNVFDVIFWLILVLAAFAVEELIRKYIRKNKTETK